MEVFRISREKYANELTASGVANRWNHDQQWVIYAGGSRSLAALELVVHRAAVQHDFNYKVMVISLPDDQSLYKSIDERELPTNWRTMDAYSKLQEFGSIWYENQSSLVLKVPSAIIPMESNYIINTKHPAFDQVILVRSEDYFWDNRLLYKH